MKFSSITLFCVFIFNFIFMQMMPDLNWSKIAIVFGGVFSGSVCLTYFQREADWQERYFKVITSMIAGLVTGSIAKVYFNISTPEYLLGNYFLAAMLSLFFLRALIQLSEKNGVEICQQAMQRILGLQTPGEKHARIYRSAIAKRGEPGRSPKPKPLDEEKGTIDGNVT